MGADRRHFSRVNFHTRAELHQGGHTWESPLIDISLKGILVRLAAPGGLDPSEPVLGIIHLADDTVIQMTLKFAHASNDNLGFYCENIDVESMGHLRRLIELNTGDPMASERELAQLAGR